MSKHKIPYLDVKKYGNLPTNYKDLFNKWYESQPELVNKHALRLDFTSETEAIATVYVPGSMTKTKQEVKITCLPPSEVFLKPPYENPY
ncbi:MAG TPA: hypothetical protein VJ742_13435 [Nitrososphaera sp.]|nr:hypothetical protein [Nitrososphaera sp.]